MIQIPGFSFQTGYSRKILMAGLVVLVASASWLFLMFRTPGAWTESEKVLISSLWIENLPPPVTNPGNAVATDPLAAELGHNLFFDKRLSATGEFSCASCHQPEKNFTDGLDKARATGQSQRNTPSIVGLVYSPWLYWDGRRDSLWSQSLSPMEDPQEQAGDRMHIVRLVTQDEYYGPIYERLFGQVPDFSDRSRFPEHAAPAINPALDSAWQGMSTADQELVNQAFANIGKAIGAYESLLVPAASRFDDYAEAVLTDNGENPKDIFSNDEIKGLRLYLDKARCMECHNGPLFTNFEFHNTGILSYPGDLPDRGRIDGVREVRKQPFNCLGKYSDASPDQCKELTYARDGAELIGAFKTPSLRNLEGTAPYMHKGQITTLEETIIHYNDAPLAMIGHNEAENPLGLLPFERRQLEAFLKTLASPVAVDERWLQPPQ